MSKRSEKSSNGSLPGQVVQLAEPAPESLPTATAGEQDVRGLAYRRWVDRGCPQGSPEEDWFEAERQLQSRDCASARPADDAVAASTDHQEPESDSHPTPMTEADHD